MKTPAKGKVKCGRVLIIDGGFLNSFGYYCALLHFIMYRSLIIVSFWLLLSSGVFGQKSDSSVLVKRFEVNILMIKEKLVADSLMNVYGDTSEAINKLRSDTALVWSIIRPNSHAHDQLICETYKIPYVIKPLGWTSDYGNIFTDDQISKLDSILSDYEKRTTNEIAVVTFDSSFIHDQNFDSLVLAIHNFWRVGKFDKNNGILIGISTAQRKIRISNGDGIESKLTDAETKDIIDYLIIPDFKQGNYFEGTKKGVLALMQKIR